MKRVILFGSMLAIVSGCENATEAPEAIKELAPFLMAHFEDDDPAEMIAATQNIEPTILDLDLEGSSTNRWFEDIPIMTDVELGSLNKHEGVIYEEQLPRAMAGISINPMQDHIDIQFEPNQVCIDSGSTKFHERTYLDGADCFAEGTCDYLDTDAEIRKETIADVWYDYEKEFRTYELDDGRKVMASRGYMPDLYDGDKGGTSWDQIFTLELWVTHPDDDSKTWRWYSIWSKAHIGVGDALYISAVKAGIDDGFKRADLWIDDAAGVEDWCNQDRNRDNDRP